MDYVDLLEDSGCPSCFALFPAARVGVVSYDDSAGHPSLYGFTDAGVS